jgi:hypothetical protein
MPARGDRAEEAVLLVAGTGGEQEGLGLAECALEATVPRIERVDAAVAEVAVGVGARVQR